MDFWQQILTKLQNNHTVYVLTVIDNLGSSPGRKGFKMMVSDDGFIYGSIGGGVMEFGLVEEARELLKKNDLKIFLKRQIHRGHKEFGSGMICSGEQSVVFHYLTPNDYSKVDTILECIKSNSEGQLVLTSTSIEYVRSSPKSKFDCMIHSADDWTFKEQLQFKNTLYIVGGGHVSVAVSELFVTLGFHVVVFDNRDHLNTLELNQSAHEKLIVDFNNIADCIEEGPQSYVAIMTNKFVDDKIVLSKLLEKNLKYLGVLGSAAKLNTMWEVLQKNGVQVSTLNKVHGPIGLPIKSQTPHEIAVSIAAEVIKIKNMTLK